MIVVIPSNRSINHSFVAPLLDRGHRLIVVDDSPGTIRADHPDIEVYNWTDRKRILGDLDDHFPRRNGACRNFGLLLAWRDASPGELIIALDDDCEVPSDFADKVERAFESRELPRVDNNEPHLNIVDCYDSMPPALFPRGFPYSKRRGYSPWSADCTVAATPKFNLGLWTDAFDVNAIDKINGPEWRHPNARLRQEQVVIPRGSLVSVCSMNMQMTRDVVPAVFQWPMHVQIMPNWVIDRYGDIWGGFTLKALMDRAGDDFTVGSPMIAHRKVGDLQRNQWQEHIAHLVNDEMIDLIVAASGDATGTNHLDRMAAFADGLTRRQSMASDLVQAYFEVLLPSLRAWNTALARAVGIGERAYFGT